MKAVRQLRQRASRSAINWFFTFLSEQYFGKPKPRSSRVNVQLWERLEDLRPDVPPLGKYFLRPAVIAIPALLVWISQQLALSGGGWVMIAAALVGQQWLYRLVFRWGLIVNEAPYIGDPETGSPRAPKRGAFLYPHRQFFRDAFSAFGAERIAVISLIAMVLLDVIAQLAGITSGHFITWLANSAFVVAVLAAIRAAFLCSQWYARRIQERSDKLRFKVKSIVDEFDEDGDPIKKLTLEKGFTTSDLANLQEGYAALLPERHTITSYSLILDQESATLTPVSEIEAKIYENIAQNLNKPVYDFGMKIAWVENDEPDREAYPERIETLTLHRYPISGLFSEDREKYWLSVISSLPKGSDGWTITDKQDDPKKVLRYGKPLSLPDSVALEESLPPTPGIAGWARIPVGQNSARAFIGMNLLRVPHILIAGGTGSGKSTLLRADMLGRLVRGHDIVVIDTVKGGNDFLTLKPWSLMWGETITEAANILAHVYEESVRRRAFLKKYKIGNWVDLTPEQRSEGKIRPLSVFYDEYENSIVARTAPKSLDKEHPLVLAAQSHNISVDYIKQYMPQLAKEARSVGIHLVVATQTPHSARIGDDLRGNLGGAIQLSAGKLEQHIVRLTMGEATGQAMTQFEKFNKPKLDVHGNKILDDDGNVVMLPGLGVVLMEGGAPTAMRVAYASEPRLPEALTGLNIAEVDPWALDDVLELKMTATVDEDDTRICVSPPFDRMSHLLGPEAMAPGSGDTSDSGVPDVSDIFNSDRWKKD